MNTMVMTAHEEGLDVWDRDIKRYLNSHYVPFYSSFDNFLDNLPKWDGKDRIRSLALRIKTDNKMRGDQFYCWSLSMVAHWKERIFALRQNIIPCSIKDFAIVERKLFFFDVKLVF